MSRRLAAVGLLGLALGVLLPRAPERFQEPHACR
jgi:hypothetical protein